MRKHHAMKPMEKISYLRAREVHSHVLKTENKRKIDDNIIYIQHVYVSKQIRAYMLSSAISIILV
jgi:hypothetical protein